MALLRAPAHAHADTQQQVTEQHTAVLISAEHCFFEHCLCLQRKTEDMSDQVNLWTRQAEQYLCKGFAQNVPVSPDLARACLSESGNGSQIQM